ncbi:RNA polymerase sigma factor [Cohnella pontilimi]|nr:sigma-70 family RNA polymerase sigma factor [Cohnella pontilimi]
MDWEQVWKNHAQELYRYIYYKVGGRQEAEDLTQETFIRLIRSGNKYEDVPVVALLKRTAARLIIDKWRSDKSRGMPLSSDELVLGDHGVGNPEKHFIQDEQIREALDVLTEDQRQIVQLRLIQGFSVKETAELTGRTETSVRTLQFRAIRNIQQALGVTAGLGGEN